VALWALHLHLFSAVIAINVEEGRLVAIDAIHLERLRATRASLVILFDFSFAFRASNVNWRFFAAERANGVFGHYKF
jgi:hypothetical protein